MKTLLRIVPHMKGSVMTGGAHPIGWNIYLRVENTLLLTAFEGVPGMAVNEQEFESARWLHFTTLRWEEVVGGVLWILESADFPMPIRDAFRALVPKVALDSMDMRVEQKTDGFTGSCTYGYHDYGKPLESSRSHSEWHQ